VKLVKVDAVAWTITGGGAYLRESVDVVEYMKNRLGLKITLFLTKWGYEVARIFGVLPRLKSIASGRYYEEFLIGDEGMYYVGRVNMGKYMAVIIAPATANTIAKIVHGIADNVATALFAQAEKSSVPIIVLPTDTANEEGFVVTETPCYINRAVCSTMNCATCQPLAMCPAKAIKIVEGYPRIDLDKCTGCTICEKLCPYNAVRCWEKIKLVPRQIDLENINKLTKMRGVLVVKSPWEIAEKVKAMLKT
jgi:dihydromethanopterin reductase (acceptor)